MSTGAEVTPVKREISLGRGDGVKHGRGKNISKLKGVFAELLHLILSESYYLQAPSCSFYNTDDQGPFVQFCFVLIFHFSILLQFSYIC